MEDIDEYKEFRVIVEDSIGLRIIKPSGVSRRGSVPMGQNRLREQTINIFNRWLAEGKIAQREELVVLGTYLYEGLFDAEISKGFKDEWDKIQNQPSTGLRLILEFEPKSRELAEMPWEYIYYPDTDQEKGFFLATRSKLILARHVPLNEDKFKDLQPEERPLRILIVVSKPVRESASPDAKMLGTVDADPVVNTIERLKSQSPKAIVTDKLLQPTKRSLMNMVRDFKPHVLHFIGHGRYTDAGGTLALVNEDNEEIASWISDLDLADCFLEHQPRLIFLHACEGAYSKSYRAFRGVALQLVYSKVSAVVAMQYQVENRVANLFAEKFYEALGQGKRIDEAVQTGRLELGMYLNEENFSSRAFGSPVVYLQSGKGIIIAAQSAPDLSGGIQPPPPLPTRFPCPGNNCPREVTAQQKFCYGCGQELMACPKCMWVMPKIGYCGGCGYKSGSTGAEAVMPPMPILES